MCHVDEQCELRDFVEHRENLSYDEPRLFFFQFTNDVETITDDKEVILMESNGQQV